MKNIENMTQDELYNFLIECGATNLKKVSSIEEAGVNFIDDSTTENSLLFTFEQTPLIEEIDDSFKSLGSNFSLNIHNCFNNEDFFYTMKLKICKEAA